MNELVDIADGEKKLCSIVCTTYNHARYSTAAIESIAQQDYPNLEIIVVDDGSTDGNDRVLRDALEASGRPFKLILQQNTGNVPMNVNRGLAVATGAYVSLFSLDDILYPDCISSKMKSLAADPDLVFVANSSNVEIDAEGTVVKSMRSRGGLARREIRSVKELLEHEFSFLGSFYVQGAVVRFDIVKAFGGYDEDMAGDDLIFRTKLLQHMLSHPNMKFSFIEAAGMAYRKHQTNLHRNLWRQVRTVVQWKNRYFPERTLPERGEKLIKRFLKNGVLQGRKDEIRDAIEFDPRIREIFCSYSNTFSYKTHVSQAALRGIFKRIYPISAK
ncbi:glycosyltransferase family A protein [Rhizobium sp. Rhizsp82]|uniref:glycosyltransferase family A protein n=1 Tax=Rhizobium sp. Rhizsp82 TaxID=3243057 RepID=UPI0039B3EF17